MKAPRKRAPSSAAPPPRRAAPVPLGDGVAARRLRMAEHDVVRLGCILAGYDGLASLHGDDAGVVFVVTTRDLAAELDAVLAEASRLVAFERLPDDDGGDEPAAAGADERNDAR